jgi:hypothetical protein
VNFTFRKEVEEDRLELRRLHFPDGAVMLKTGKCESLLVAPSGQTYRIPGAADPRGRCRNGLEEDPGAFTGMTYGDDDEVAFFPGAANPRAAEDNKRLNFSRKVATQAMVQMMDAPGTAVCSG